MGDLGLFLRKIFGDLAAGKHWVHDSKSFMKTDRLFVKRFSIYLNLKLAK